MACGKLKSFGCATPRAENIILCKHNVPWPGHRANLERQLGAWIPNPPSTSSAGQQDHPTAGTGQDECLMGSAWGSWDPCSPAVALFSVPGCPRCSLSPWSLSLLQASDPGSHLLQPPSCPLPPSPLPCPFPAVLSGVISAVPPPSSWVLLKLQPRATEEREHLSEAGSINAAGGRSSALSWAPQRAKSTPTSVRVLWQARLLPA